MGNCFKARDKTLGKNRRCSHGVQLHCDPEKSLTRTPDYIA